MFEKCYGFPVFLCPVGSLLIETQYCHKLYILPIANRQADKRAVADTEPVLWSLEQQNLLK